MIVKSSEIRDKNHHQSQEKHGYKLMPLPQLPQLYPNEQTNNNKKAKNTMCHCFSFVLVKFALFQSSYMYMNIKIFLPAIQNKWAIPEKNQRGELRKYFFEKTPGIFKFVTLS